MKGTEGVKVDLSIDFDFFVREEGVWDWGHKESTFFLNDIWPIRSLAMDIEKETDLKYADFDPITILPHLKDKGLKLDGRTKLWLCESHAGMIHIPNLTGNLIMMDAHHDLWGTRFRDDNYIETADIGCGNWLSYLIQEGRVKNATLVFPGWQEQSMIEDAVKRNKNGSVVRWQDFVGGNYVVANVFVCRSGCWVPPHHDEKLKLMLCFLMYKIKKVVQLGDIDILQPRQVKYCSEQERKNWKDRLMADRRVDVVSK